MNTKDLLKTPLYQLHIDHDGRMVPFGGYAMPVQYATGIKHEHLHVRSQAGLFDISHMGQVKLTGDYVAQALEKLVPGCIQSLAEHQQCYTVLTNVTGGTIDDLMVTNAGDHFFLVLNAACKKTDLSYLHNQLNGSCKIEELTDQALLALQGPQAAAVMQRLFPEVNNLTFMTSKRFKINGIPCFVNRCGYTGEDGFEISIPSNQAENFALCLLEQPEVELIGLGARDSLRLEAGYCLYGHDLDVNTTPVEAGLNWIIAKSRLHDSSQTYPGIERIREQITNGPEVLRVGIQSEGRAPLREGMDLLNDREEVLGTISSGGFGPSVAAPIAMAYVKKEYTTLGQQFNVDIRGRIQRVNVVGLPFIKHRYHNN
jgi:glycine cleavage system T protein (aminomethyltransferase)